MYEQLGPQGMFIRVYEQHSHRGVHTGVHTGLFGGLFFLLIVDLGRVATVRRASLFTRKDAHLEIGPLCTRSGAPSILGRSFLWRRSRRADTSECKRIFSLMNDLKTAERSKLGNATLKNLMTWHVLGKQVKCEQLPVMSILKEFRDMAGGKGRKPHKPSEPPVYDYQLAS